MSPLPLTGHPMTGTQWSSPSSRPITSPSSRPRVAAAAPHLGLNMGLGLKESFRRLTSGRGASQGGASPSGYSPYAGRGVPGGPGALSSSTFVRGTTPTSVQGKSTFVRGTTPTSVQGKTFSSRGTTIFVQGGQAGGSKTADVVRSKTAAPADVVVSML